MILAGIAAYFLWNGNRENSFVAAIFGAVSFFLSIRFQVKERLKQREIEREEENARLADSNGSRQPAEDASFDEQLTTDDQEKTKRKVL